MKSLEEATVQYTGAGIGKMGCWEGIKVPATWQRKAEIGWDDIYIVKSSRLVVRPQVQRSSYPRNYGTNEAWFPFHLYIHRLPASQLHFIVIPEAPTLALSSSSVCPMRSNTNYYRKSCERNYAYGPTKLQTNWLVMHKRWDLVSTYFSLNRRISNNFS